MRKVLVERNLESIISIVPVAQYKAGETLLETESREDLTLHTGIHDELSAEDIETAIPTTWAFLPMDCGQLELAVLESFAGSFEPALSREEFFPARIRSESRWQRSVELEISDRMHGTAEGHVGAVEEDAGVPRRCLPRSSPGRDARESVDRSFVPEDQVKCLHTPRCRGV
ncbi:hypothetical protein ANO11243_067270 [Dothideomycetidae sp. 11243]|nr:hypothetical protein ANO11243_067270 [fungal sp. No.11243]